jgi:hypothetical protein
MWTMIVLAEGGYSVSTFSSQEMAKSAFKSHTTRRDVRTIALYTPEGVMSSVLMK